MIWPPQAESPNDTSAPKDQGDGAADETNEPRKTSNARANSTVAPPSQAQKTKPARDADELDDSRERG